LAELSQLHGVDLTPEARLNRPMPALRKLAAILVIAAAPLVAQAQAPAPQPDPALVDRAVGPWELSNPAGDRKCAVTFKPERSGTGRGLLFSEGCATAFPAVVGASAWTISPNGGIRWLDRAGTALFDFDETEVGIFESLRAGDSNVYFLTNLGLAGKTLPTADEVAGLWSLGQPRGRALCTLTLKQELAEGAGPLEQRFAMEIAEGCERSVAALGLAHWRLERELLVLGGRTSTVLSFKREPDGRWIKTPVDNRPLVMIRQ
jgi:hypothetical protein